MSEQLRRCWQRSTWFRIALVAAVLYAILRLAVHGAYLAIMLNPTALPEWAAAEEPMVPADLQIYLNAARHFRERSDLYLKGSLERLEDHYPYAPSFALCFIPFSWMSLLAVVIVHTTLHILAYALMYTRWWHIFERAGIQTAKEVMIQTLPLWLIFSAFWGDLSYLNIYLPMALLGTLFIEAVLNERLWWSLTWLTIILQIKPHWAFAIGVPLLLGRYRFFVRLLLLSIVTYAGVFAVVALVGGPSYAWHQYIDYARFLARLSRDFPWRGPDKPFLGYNHSIKQIVVYLLGVNRSNLLLATVIKVLLLMPLGIVGLRFVLSDKTLPQVSNLREDPGEDSSPGAALVKLDWALVLYLAAFIWLDMVWEVSLGIAVFAYLLATTTNRRTRALVWGVFLPYALVDVIQTLSFLLFGMRVMAPGPYILTDPSIYLPLTMIVILTFYALLLRRLWRVVAVGGKRETLSQGVANA